VPVEDSPALTTRSGRAKRWVFVRPPASSPSWATSSSGLLEIGDAALYRAKTAGRNRYAIAPEATNANLASTPGRAGTDENPT
jgi:hypothetical protein